MYIPDRKQSLYRPFIFFFLTFTSTFTFSHNGAFLQQIVMNYNKFYLLVLCTWQLIQFQASVWDLILQPASDLLLVKSVQHTTLFWSQHLQKRNVLPDIYKL